MARKSIFSVILAITLVMVSAPLFAPDDSDALVRESNMALDSDSAVIYVAAGDNHSATFTASITGSATGTISWKLNNLGDGTNVISFSDTTTETTATGNSVTVYGKSVGSIEVEAYLAGNETNYHVSAVVLVRSAATAAATEFYFWFQVYGDTASTYVDTYGNAEIKTNDAWASGFWVHVTQAEVQEWDSSVTEFNAMVALNYIYSTHDGWQLSFSNYGWINTFMGLGTYSSGSTYYYWAQYHLDSNGAWAFNNSTLGFIDTQDHAYIGLIFWGSPSSSDVPPSPSLPVSDYLLD